MSVSSASAELRRDCVDVFAPQSVEIVINNFLSHFAYDDAIILAEAYYGKSKTDEAFLLYAQSLMRANRISDAYELLKKEGYHRTSKTRYLFAKCAYDLKELGEADAALRHDCGNSDLRLYEGFDETSACHAHALLAKIYTEIAKISEAKKHYGMALVANPLMWTANKAYTHLCGESIGRLFDNLVEDDAKQIKSLRKLNERMQKAMQYFGSDSESSSTSVPPGKKRKIPGNSQAQSSPSSARSTSRRRSSSIGASDKSVIEWIFQMSEVQDLLSKFKCTEALAMLENIPLTFQQHSLTLRIRGTILFEIPDYKRCVHTFRELRRLFPSRIDEMEIYSTALWHLQDEHQLSALASELVKTHRESPITWCVVGNSLSLQKHHESAIEAFERAIQMNNRFAYAYCLLGHELVGLHDLQRAEDAFKQATIHAPNDYRALFGLGQVHFKGEQFFPAKVALNKAVAVNPRNTVILCLLAVVEHALRQSDEALMHLNKALTLDPTSVLSRYHKARIFFDIGEYHKAELELNQLRSLSPEEAHVFFLLGRVHRKLGNQHLAMLNFSWATEIDPRGEQNQSTVSEAGPYDDDAADLTNDSGRRNSSVGMSF